MKYIFDVTIGIVVKNMENTILNAINSTFNQDYPHERIEIIVVDGYSIDKTVDILKLHLDINDIKYEIFFEKVGLGYARQIVVNNAKGKYIIWLDGDMILSKEYVKKMIDFMEKNPSVGIAKGKYGLNKNDNLVATLENIYFVINFSSSGKMESASLATSGCIYRVDAIKKIGGFNEKIIGAGEDEDIEKRIRSAGWSLNIVSTIFYEQHRKTWKSLWEEYYWHGKGASYHFQQHNDIIHPKNFFFPVLLVREILRIKTAYRLTKRKGVVLLPFHYCFKRIAWILGFLSTARQDVA